jgi:AbrB family looped-hinge helix DNA binding protein
MLRSKLTSDGQTTVPAAVREVLKLGPGDELTWEIRDGRVAVTTGRPLFWRWEGFIKVGPGDVVADVAEARRGRGRI